ncbi:hypothetical protein [Thioalkalivibrio sulfidiphilus]|uniref:hypothetical protein n=1 Tax=Thioalkalivibrio sulfidiphilus TaxID=1033854 RepID=UPI003BAEDEBB
MMLGELASALRWGRSLGMRFVRVVPLATALIVALTLVSQVAMLLASFLPLKVVILLGSDGMPRYFPAAFAAMDRDVLIASLSAATLGFFLLYQLAEHLIDRVTVNASSRLLERSAKMVLFDNQQEVAASAYQRYSRMLAGGVFVLLAACLLGWLYPGMAVLMLVYSLTAGGAVLWTHHRYLHARRDPEDALGNLLQLAASLGFFLAFAFLVVDFVFLAPPGVLIAILALLLVRQAMTRLAALVKDLRKLNSQRTRLDALFFHGKVLLPQGARRERGIWPLLQPALREHWVAQLLAETPGKPPHPKRIRWWPSGTANVATLLVEVEGGSTTWLIKLYEVNRHAQAQHEAALTSEPPERLPAPRLIRITQVERFECMLYRLPTDSASIEQASRHDIDLARETLLEVTPGQELAKRYLRSKPALWQRITPEMANRLEVAVDSPEDRTQLARFREVLPRLREALAEMPLCFVNPDIGPESLWPGEGSVPWILNWGRWSLEPVGAGWPLRGDGLEQLGNALGRAARQRTELADVKPSQAQLAAIAHGLEGEYLRQRYPQTLKLLPSLFEALDGCRTPQETP